jgi:hypothetical protein
VGGLETTHRDSLSPPDRRPPAQLEPATRARTSIWQFEPPPLAIA